MKKNNKGFTLVEILAAIVILGLLFSLATTTIIKTISAARGKVYVSDAQKLISQAEYKIKASSSVIKKPSPGNCIVISLVFLDSSDFDSPPNGGEYLEEASFVVVKNTGTKLEYSASLIEKKKKGGYEGIYLSTNAALISGSATVKNFSKDEIVYVETPVFNEEYINNSLGDSYCGRIERIYNTPDLTDSSVQTYNSAPKITKATLVSESGKSYNSLDALLSLKADDNDSDRGELKVCISPDSYLLAENNCEPYGSNSMYTKSFDFRNYNGVQYTYDGSLVTLFIVVKDPDGASTKKKVEYKIHNNTAPVVDYENSGLSKREVDDVNGTTAKFTLVVGDDIDGPSDLLVCFSEDGDNNCNSSNNYSTYGSYFGQNNYFYYEFKCSDRGLDGSSHSVTVYLKDSLGFEIEPVTFSYKFGTTQLPPFENSYGSLITLTPIPDNNITEGSMHVIVKFKLLDQLDVDKNNNIKVKIEEFINNSPNQLVDEVYSLQKAILGYDITFSNKSGKYDGSIRTLRVTIYEENNPSNYNYEEVQYQLHKNTLPEVYDIYVRGNGSDLCNNLPDIACGSLSSISSMVNFKAYDDLGTSSLTFCVSENISGCSNANSFKKYTPDALGTYSVPYKFLAGQHPYDGSRKTVYVFVKDSYGEVNCYSYSDYVLYKNEAPKIDALEVESVGRSGSLKILVTPRVYTGRTSPYGVYYYADDIDLNQDLGYKLYVDDKIVKSLTIDDLNRLKADPRTDWSSIDTFDKLINQQIEIDLSHFGFTEYDGFERIIKFELYDQYNEFSAPVTYYKVYENTPPEINNFSIQEESNACESCYGGGYNVLLDLKVTDDMDTYDDMSVCISEEVDLDHIDIDGSCFRPYNTLFKNGYYSYTFSGEDDFLPYRGQTKTLHAVVRDSSYRVAYAQIDYKLYNNMAPELLGSPEVTSTVKKAKSKDALLNINVEDDFMDLYAQICYAPEGSENYICTDDFVENNKFVESAYNTAFNFSIDTTKYQGQKFDVYARIKDAYGESITTDKVSYTIHNDATPVIKSVQAVTGVTGLTSSQGVVSFSVKDYLDTYKVCVNTTNSSNGCTFIDKLFDGTTEDYYNITYDFGSNSKTATYYLFVKDSNGNISSSKSFTFGTYKSCDSYNTSDEKSTYNVASNGTYTQPDGTKVVVSNNSKITQTRCSGRCYYWDSVYDSNGKLKYKASDTSDITAYYKKTISYKDRFNDNNYCASSVSYVKVTCGYIDCFYNSSSNYVNKAIGLKGYISDKAWTYTALDGTTNVYDIGSHYFKMYTTKYTAGTNKITLTETNQRVPVDMIGEYEFDSAVATPYIRVLDEIDYDNFISNVK